MQGTHTLPRLTAGGIEVDLSAEAFGYLRDSSDLANDGSALAARMGEDGYLFLPGFLDREAVRAARLEICQVLAQEGHLDPDHDPAEAIAAPGVDFAFRPDIASKSPVRGALEKVIYGDRIMEFYSRLLGGPATHYEFTWLRTIPPGQGSYPHCDVVFMGRGTKNLYTAWVPLGDVPLTVGGLVLVEGSHRDQEIRDGYCSHDIDTVCQNKPETLVMEESGFHDFGALSRDMPAIRSRIGRRLLTANEFRMGDLLTFSVYTVHGSLDNASKEIRLSSDSRYQLASDPIDERWIGENPPGHGGNSLKRLIC